MKKLNLSKLDWKLNGSQPWFWKLGTSMELGEELQCEIKNVPATVPGSVQKALLNAGIIKDWNSGLNSRDCEWVENRHWIYSTTIPAEYFNEGSRWCLNFKGLDYRGIVYVNGKELASFDNAHIPLTVDFTSSVKENPGKELHLSVVFLLAPRWQGQCGYTYKMLDWKPRFNYHWDWVCRLVQIGIWNDVILETYDEKLLDTRCYSTFDGSNGKVEIRGEIDGDPDNIIHTFLKNPDGNKICENDFTIAQLRTSQISLDVDSPQLWFPNGKGNQPLYQLLIQLKSKDGKILDDYVTKIGFRQVKWLSNENARGDADGWICEVNGEKLFLQGINWTPLLPNFADTTDKHYRHILETYRDMGINLLRVWGGGFLEKEVFYNLCDEMGLMVWQEFPLSSSGVDNSPPTDAEAIQILGNIARSFIKRRQQHPSLIIWCGGNELNKYKDKQGVNNPVTINHPTIRNFYDIVCSMDPDKRFVTASPSGPELKGNSEDFKTKVLWDSHGPWKAIGPLDGEWKKHWEDSNSLLYGEFGAPGASGVILINQYKGDLDAFPCSNKNDLWSRQNWWIEWDQFVNIEGHEPENLEEYVGWSQKRQSDLLAFAVTTAKNKFPRCGGVIIWMGHDCFPCTANTAIIDFEGNMKPAAKALAKIFKES